jgi:hypothetical protein
VKASAAVVAIGLACVVAGCSDDDEETPQGREQPSLMAEIAVQGGSRRERDLLRTVARGMDRTTLQSISIGPVTGRRKADFGGTAVPVAFTATPGAERAASGSSRGRSAAACSRPVCLPRSTQAPAREHSPRGRC